MSTKPLTARELQSLRNLGEEGEAAAEEIEWLTAENFKLAAGQCVNATGDEGGTPRCAEIDRLRAELAAALAQRVANVQAQYRLYPPHPDWQHSGAGVMTARELQSLHNLGNEGEAAADQIKRLTAERDALREDAARWRKKYHDCRRYLRDANRGAAILSGVCQLRAARDVLNARIVRKDAKP